MSFIVDWYRIPHELVNKNILNLERVTDFNFVKFSFHGIGDMELQELTDAISIVCDSPTTPVQRLYTNEAYFDNPEAGPWVVVVSNELIAEIANIPEFDCAEIADLWAKQETTHERFEPEHLLEVLKAMRQYCKQHDHNSEKIVAITCA